MPPFAPSPDRTRLGRRTWPPLPLDNYGHAREELNDLAHLDGLLQAAAPGNPKAPTLLGFMLWRLWQVGVMNRALAERATMMFHERLEGDAYPALPMGTYHAASAYDRMAMEERMKAFLREATGVYRYKRAALVSAFAS